MIAKTVWAPSSRRPAPSGRPIWSTAIASPEEVRVGAVAGYPAISVPAGFIHGLPVGISFFGAAYSRPTLIKLAFACEQATKHRRAPGFLPTLSLRTSVPEPTLRRAQHWDAGTVPILRGSI